MQPQTLPPSSMDWSFGKGGPPTMPHPAMAAMGGKGAPMMSHPAMAGKGGPPTMHHPAMAGKGAPMMSHPAMAGKGMPMTHPAMAGKGANLQKPDASAPEDNDFYGPPQDSNDATYDWPVNNVKAEKSEKAESTKGSMASAAPQVGMIYKVLVKPRSMFIGLSMLVLFLMMLIPIWNSIGLLDDDIFSYMCGTTVSSWLLTCCILILLISFFTLWVFLRRSRPDVRSEETMLMIGGVLLSTVGIMLILFGGPLSKEATKASNEFFDQCKEGARALKLYATSQELESLRRMPHCIHKDSVEDCAGYGAYPNMREANVLKVMENRLGCAGMCNGMDAKGNPIFPPTLFNRANYTLTCNGMAARHLRNYAGEISKQTVSEGVMLVVTAIVISFGQLITFCAKNPREKTETGKDYGSTKEVTL